MGATTPSEPSSRHRTDAGTVIARDGELAIRLMRDAPQDYELMAQWLNDEQVSVFWHGRDEAFPMERVLEKYGPRTRGEGPTTPCFVTADGRPIGYIQFYRPDDWSEWRDRIGLEPWAGRWALDIVIGEPELWNRGLGTRAVTALLRYLFSEKGAEEVVLSPVAENTRAIRSYEKAGFHKVRLIPKGEFLGGEWRDAWLLSVQPDRPD
jgi:aminoglycoside 6'-N-acetyltransferase